MLWTGPDAVGASGSVVYLKLPVPRRGRSSARPAWAVQLAQHRGAGRRFPPSLSPVLARTRPKEPARVPPRAEGLLATAVCKPLCGTAVIKASLTQPGFQRLVQHLKPQLFRRR